MPRSRRTPGGSKLGFDPLNPSRPDVDPDKWMRDLLTEYLGQIESRIGTRFARTQGRLRKPVGCGAFGCVFLLEDGRVFKLTQDDAEGAYSLFVQRAQQAGTRCGKTPMISVTAEVFDVFVFPKKKRTEHGLVKVYGIVREQVGESNWRLSREMRQGLTNYTNGWDLYCQNPSQSEPVLATMGGALARLALMALESSSDPHAKKIADFLTWAWDRKMPFMDLHPDNVARRLESGPDGSAMVKNQVILFDYGGSVMEDERGRCLFPPFLKFEREISTL